MYFKAYHCGDKKTEGLKNNLFQHLLNLYHIYMVL